jgi:large subunit ribosomal protein L3
MQILSLIGKKIYQKQGFLQDGTRIPLTGVFVGGNFISQIKTQEKEGYNALQLGIDIKKKASKAELGHSKKAGLKNTPRFFREIRVDDANKANLGSELNVAEVFEPGDIIDVTGISKGKGWAGVVKRHGFRGGPRTHGQSDRERAPGSIGQTTTPGRVYKGKRMAGRMGQQKVTIKNLEVIEVTNDGVLIIKGLVPGSLNSILTIKKVGKNKKFVPLYKEVVEKHIQETQENEEFSQPSLSKDVSKTDHKDSNSESSASISEIQINESSLKDSKETKEEVSVSDSYENGQTVAPSEKAEKTKEEVGQDANS